VQDAPLRFGILGAARIAQGAMIAPARELGCATVTAIGASSAERASAFAAHHAIPASGTYDDLINRTDVDVVYIALPPSAHAEWTLKALAAGKHVLLEKPAVTTYDEAVAIDDAAKSAGLRVIEAFHYRYHPLFAHVLEIVRSGQLGTLQTAHAEFSVPIARNADEFRWKAALGGGALADLGCYCVHWLRTIAGEEPTITGAAQWLEPDGCDRRTEATLLFPGGMIASLATDMDQAGSGAVAILTVTGSEGRLEIINPLAPQKGHQFLQHTAGGTREEQFERKPTFEYQLEAVCTALRNGNPLPTEGNDLLGNAKAMQNCRKIAKYYK
jgi:predicted dehydrogenase